MQQRGYSSSVELTILEIIHLVHIVTEIIAEKLKESRSTINRLLFCYVSQAQTGILHGDVF
jgi:hypothetical protein